MAEMKVGVVIDASVKGREAVEGLNKDLQGLGAAGDQAKGGGERAAQGIGQAGAAAASASGKLDGTGRDMQGVGQAGSAAKEGAQQAAQGLARTASAAGDTTEQLGATRKGLISISTQLAEAQQGLQRLAASMAGAFTFRELVNAAAQMESMREGLRAVSGSAEQAGKDMDFVRTVANRVGADVTQVGQAFLGLQAATKGTAVEGEPTRQVFEAVATAMGKAGKSASETQNALVALAQMASKGTVSMEELRGQLGEALPGALQAAANGLGITTQDLIKLVEEGQIAASDLFPALSKGLNDLYGGAPAAQTLSQEITNIKNAFTEMAANIGEAGGLDALKVGAEVAQTAIVLLDDTLITVGKTLGVLAGAVATLDFSAVEEAFADIEKESRDKLLKAAQHNDTLRGYIKSMGNEALSAAVAQQELAKSTQQAGQAAAAQGSAWVNLATDYGKVLEAVREQIAQAEKSVIARDAEGKASVALAAAFGTETQQREAQAKAAQANAQELEKLAQLKTTELNVMQAELAALKALAAEQGKLDDAKTKQLQELQKQIALRQQDADKAVAQAQAGRLAAESAKLEAEAYKDNSARLGELRDAYERTRAKLQEVRAARAAGKATAEDVTKAELEAGKAALVYRDALQDQMRAIEAKRNLQLTDLDVQSATIRLAIEQQQRIYEVAKARGDERGAIAAQNEIRRMEIELLTLTAQAKRIEAEAAIASAQAKRAELIAAGEYNGAKKLEIEAALKAAEVKRLEGDIAETTANKLRDLANVQGQLKGSTDSTTSSIQQQTNALNKLAGAAGGPFAPGRRSSQGEELGAGVQEVGSSGNQFRNRDGMTSDAKGNVQQQFVWTRSSIIEYLKSAGLEDVVAEELSKQFLNSQGGVDYEASSAQKRWAGKYGTLEEALGKVAEYSKYDEAGQIQAADIVERAKRDKELRERQRNPNATTSDRAPPPPPPPPPPAAPVRNASQQELDRLYLEQNKLAPNQTRYDLNDPAQRAAYQQSIIGASPTYVSNITIPGVAGTTTLRYADADSQRNGEDLLRKLAQAKGASI